VSQVNVIGGTPSFSGNATKLTVTAGSLNIGAGAAVGAATLNGGTLSATAGHELAVSGVLTIGPRMRRAR